MLTYQLFYIIYNWCQHCMHACIHGIFFDKLLNCYKIDHSQR